MSFAGVRAVEGGGRAAMGEESGVGEACWARGVEGRVESSWVGLTVRFRDS